MKKKILVVALVLALIVSAFAGCGGGEGDADTVKLGGIAPLTGELAVYGVPTNNGIQLAIDEINANGGVLGKQIEFFSYDEKGDATEAVNAYNKLVQNDGVCAIIGDVTSGNTVAVAQQSVADNIPIITPTGTSVDITKQGENVFRACFIDPYQGQTMASYAQKELGAKTAAILYNTSDDYSIGCVAAFEEQAKALGLQIVAKEGYKKGDVDFKAQLTTIAGKSPEVLFVPVYAEDVALITVQAKTVGVKATFLGVDGWDGVVSKIDASNIDAVEGALFTNHYSPQGTEQKLVDFIANYTEKFGEAPISFSALGYDAVYMMVQAIEAAGSTDSQAIIDALKAVDFAGTTGTMKFDENRNPVKSAFIITIKGGEYEFVKEFK